MSGIISGYVTEAGVLRPVAGARIAIRFLGVVGADRSANRMEGATDATGRFAFADLEPGLWSVACAAAQRAPIELTTRVYDNAVNALEIEIPAADYGPNGVAPMIQQGRIEGVVVAHGRPVEDASITVLSGAGAAPDIAPLTNAAGAFSLDALPAGDWTFEARTPDGETGRINVRIVAGQTISVVIEASSASDMP